MSDKTADNQMVHKTRRRHETVRKLLEGLFSMAASDIMVLSLDLHQADGDKIATTTIRGAPDVVRKPKKARGPRRSRPRKPSETEEQRKKRLAAEHSAAYRARKKQEKAASTPKPEKAPRKKAKKK